MSKIFLIALPMLCLTACDPAISVVIANHTSADKHIKVYYPENFKLPGKGQNNMGIKDSRMYDLKVADNYAHPIVIPMSNPDTTARTYDFVLKANHQATVESRFLAMYPTYGQKFVIDGVDTVTLEEKNKTFKKRPRLTFGGAWTYVIENKK